ncbi:MAG: hypothetical protein WA138_08570 [Parvibaculum sp.]
MIVRPNRAMSLTPMENLRWGLAYGRGLGVLAALGLVIVWQLERAPALDLLSVLMIVLPVMEVGLFAGVFAIYRNSISEEEAEVRGQGVALVRGFAAFALWFAVVFVVSWVSIVVVQASVDAYVELGMPPALDLMP